MPEWMGPVSIAPHAHKSHCVLHKPKSWANTVLVIIATFGKFALIDIPRYILFSVEDSQNGRFNLLGRELPMSTTLVLVTSPIITHGKLITYVTHVGYGRNELIHPSTFDTCKNDLFFLTWWHSEDSSYCTHQCCNNTNFTLCSAT